MVLAPMLQIMSDSVLFPTVLSITNIAILAETIGQLAENIDAIDDSPNLEHKRGLVHIEILAADMEYDLLLMAAIRLVDVFYLAKHLLARLTISLTFYILTWDN